MAAERIGRVRVIRAGRTAVGGGGHDPHQPRNRRANPRRSGSELGYDAHHGGAAMPIRDWSRVPSGLFHDFHQSWSIRIKDALERRPPAQGGRSPRRTAGRAEGIGCPGDRGPARTAPRRRTERPRRHAAAPRHADRAPDHQVDRGRPRQSDRRHAPSGPDHCRDRDRLAGKQGQPRGPSGSRREDGQLPPPRDSCPDRRSLPADRATRSVFTRRSGTRSSRRTSPLPRARTASLSHTRRAASATPTSSPWPSATPSRTCRCS